MHPLCACGIGARARSIRVALAGGGRACTAYRARWKMGRPLLAKDVHLHSAVTFGHVSHDAASALTALRPPHPRSPLVSRDQLACCAGGTARGREARRPRRDAAAADREGGPPPTAAFAHGCAAQSGPQRAHRGAGSRTHPSGPRPAREESAVGPRRPWVDERPPPGVAAVNLGPASTNSSPPFLLFLCFFLSVRAAWGGHRPDSEDSSCRMSP